jgi:hypothetical protein
MSFCEHLIADELTQMLVGRMHVYPRQSHNRGDNLYVLSSTVIQLIMGMMPCSHGILVPCFGAVWQVHAHLFIVEKAMIAYRGTSKASKRISQPQRSCW